VVLGVRREARRSARCGPGAARWLALGGLALAFLAACGDTQPPLEIFALRYGESRFPERQLFADASGRGTRDFAWLLYLVRAGNKKVLIDTGIGAAAYHERFGIEEAVDVVELLRRVGETPLSITHVILTHTHPDHVGNLHLFPNARVYLHRDSLERLLGDPNGRQQVRALGIGMFSPFDERTLVIPGLEAFHVGGHTRDSVAVELVRGERRFLFPSDNCPLPENCRSARASGSVEDAAANRAFVERFADYPGEIFTHHDPAPSGEASGPVVRVYAEGVD
jgi:glyoxylase-like metal-dependent hydrolase (beta-lactamase superfamily II)